MAGCPPEGVTIHPIVRIGRRAAEGVIEAATELDADLIVFGWAGKPPASKPGAGAAVFSPTIDASTMTERVMQFSPASEAPATGLSAKRSVMSNRK